MSNIKCECGNDLRLEYNETIGKRIPLNDTETVSTIEDSMAISDVCFYCPNCGEVQLTKAQLEDASKIIEDELPYLWYNISHLLETKYLPKD